MPHSSSPSSFLLTTLPSQSCSRFSVGRRGRSIRRRHWSTSSNAPIFFVMPNKRLHSFLFSSILLFYLLCSLWLLLVTVDSLYETDNNQPAIIEPPCLLSLAFHTLFWILSSRAVAAPLLSAAPLQTNPNTTSSLLRSNPSIHQYNTFW